MNMIKSSKGIKIKLKDCATRLEAPGWEFGIHVANQQCSMGCLERFSLLENKIKNPGYTY